MEVPGDRSATRIPKQFLTLRVFIAVDDVGLSLNPFTLFTPGVGIVTGKARQR